MMYNPRVLYYENVRRKSFTVTWVLRLGSLDAYVRWLDSRNVEKLINRIFIKRVRHCMQGICNIVSDRSTDVCHLSTFKIQNMH